MAPARPAPGAGRPHGHETLLLQDDRLPRRRLRHRHPQQAGTAAHRIGRPARHRGAQVLPRRVRRLHLHRHPPLPPRNDQPGAVGGDHQRLHRRQLRIVHQAHLPCGRLQRKQHVVGDDGQAEGEMGDHQHLVQYLHEHRHPQAYRLHRALQRQQGRLRSAGNGRPVVRRDQCQ